MSMCPRLRILALILLIAIAAFGCDDNTLTSFEPEVTNVADNFQLQATKVRAVSTTLNYRWQNTGTLAKISHSTTTTFGSARIVIRDSAGTQVYEHDLVPSLDETSAAGTAGYWTIQVVLDRYDGNLSFRVQKQ
jgi:hypothetical protein